jgi:acyl carrier protein phosphodiesterase
VNFLAHALLAGTDPGLRLGGVLGDFVKGPLPAGLAPRVAAGVLLHRRIDSYAEAHPVFCRSRSRVSGERRRYAGIMVDLFYDHFLAAHWGRYCDQPLADFTRDTYALLLEHGPELPPRLARILPAMQAEDWLASYRSLDAVGLALDRIASHRLSRPNRLAGAVEELAGNYGGLGRDFAEFFADALNYAARHRAH